MKNLQLTLFAVLFSFSAFAIGAITGPTSVCVPNFIQLSDTTAGGTWSSSNTTIATIATYGDGYVSGVLAGTATITYTAGSSYAVTTVTVNAGITPITGRNGVCGLDTFTLKNATSGGIWTSNNTAIATVGASSGFVTTIAAGEVMISYTIGGCYVINSVTVGEPPLPDMLGCDNIGIGDTLTLIGVKYGSRLTGDYSKVDIFPDGRIVGKSIGPAEIALFNLLTGCLATKKTINVTTTALISPITGNGLMCPGMSLALSDITPGGTWSISNTAMATITPTGVVTGVAFGRPVVTYTTSLATCTAPVFIQGNPPAIAGRSSVCVNDTMILMSSTSFYNRWDTSILKLNWYDFGPFPIDGIRFYSRGTFTSSDTAIVNVSTGNLYDKDHGYTKGISAGSAIIKYTDNYTGCAVTATVAVETPPSLPAITGSTGVCAGNVITLSNAATGGIWSSSNTAIATAGVSTGLVRGVAGGSTIISYSASNTCGTSLQTTAINVDAAIPLIAGITGVMPLCRGSFLLLSNVTPGGMWSSSNTAVSSVGATTGSVYGITAGTAVISYTLSNACDTNGSAATIFVDPLPAVITGDTVICLASSTILGNASPGGAWSSSDPLVAAISSTGIVMSVAIGTTTITYTLSTGCLTTYNISVTTAPAPITGTTGISMGSYSTLSDAMPGGTWSTSDFSIAPISPTSGNMLGALAGTATITYTIGSCSSYTTVTVISMPLATQNITDNDALITVYPNPANGVLNIQWQNQVTGRGNIVVTDVTGRTVFTSSLDINKASGAQAIDLRSLNNGMFILKVSGEHTSYCGKLLIQK